MSHPGYCPKCEREWNGSSLCHCATCCETFSSDSAFDLHLASPNADINCYDPATLVAGSGKPRLVVVAREWGPVWARPTYGAHPFQGPVRADAVHPESFETGVAA